MKEIMKDDYVKIGKREFKYNSLPYWLIRIGQAALVFGWISAMYIGILVLVGGI